MVKLLYIFNENIEIYGKVQSTPVLGTWALDCEVRNTPEKESVHLWRKRENLQKKRGENGKEEKKGDVEKRFIALVRSYVPHICENDHSTNASFFEMYS